MAETDDKDAASLRLHIFELEQKERTEAQVKALIEVEKARLKQTISFATKAIGVAAAAIGALLAVAGWASWDGVLKQMNERVDADLKQQLTVNVPVGVEKSVERIRLAALLHAFPATPAAGEDYNPKFDGADIYALTQGDWDVLAKAFSDPSGSLLLCTSATAVVYRVSNTGHTVPAAFVATLKQLISSSSALS